MPKPHIHVTAAVIRKNNRILLTKRPKEADFGNFWEFPGGKQEPGETLETCLEREIEEEVGIKIHAQERLMTVDHEYGSKFISLHVFACTILEGKPQAIECKAFQWVAPRDLDGFELPPPDMQVVDFLRKTSRQSGCG